MNKNLLEPDFFNLNLLTKRWNCTVEDILHYGITSDLPLYVVSTDWHLEIGIENDDGVFQPKLNHLSNDEFFRIYPAGIRALLKKGRCGAYFEDKFGYPARFAEHYYQDRDECFYYLQLSEIILRIEDIRAFEEAQKPSEELRVISNYTAPYLHLMMRGIEEHSISNENQEKVNFLKDWFLSQKIDGHPISGNEAKSMATFIRLPKSKKGGNKPHKRRVEG